MEPFSVTCSNCKGKLIVKNEKLAGQIVPCPRCQDPVTIPTLKKVLFTPPPGMEADSVAITKGIDDDWGQDLDRALAAARDHLAAVPAPPPPQTPSQSQVIDASRSVHDFPVDEEFRLAPVDEPPLALPPPVVSDSRPLTAANELRGVSRQRDMLARKPAYQQPIFIAFLGLSGLVVSFGLFYLFTRVAKNGTRAKDALVQKDPTPDNLTKDPKSVSDKEQDAVSEKNKVTVDPNSPPSIEPQENIASSKGTAETNDSDTKPRLDPSALLNPDVNRTAANTEKPSASGEVPIVPKTPDPSSRMPLQETPAEARPEIPSILKSLVGSIEKFEVDNSDIGSLPSDVASTKDKVGEPIDIYVPIHLTPAEKVDPNAALSMPIGKMRLSDKSIADFAHLLSASTGIGIQMHLESLWGIGLSPSSKVDVDASDTTVKDLLAETLSPLGLRVSADGDQGTLFIHATDEALTAKLPKSWNLKGLVDDDKLSDLASVLALLLPDESAHWKLEGSEVVWQPAVKPIFAMRLALVLDRIRAAQGLPTQSTFHPELLVPGLDIDGVLSKLSQTFDKEVPQRRPLAQILYGAAKDRGMTLLFDWNGLWRHGMSPTKEKLCLTRHREFRQIFQEFEEDFALELTALDRRTLLLTVPEVRRTLSQIRVMRLDSEMTLDKLRTLLRPLSPVDSNRRSRLVVAQVPGRPFALARVCPPTLEQIQILQLP